MAEQVYVAYDGDPLGALRKISAHALGVYEARGFVEVEVSADGSVERVAAIDIGRDGPTEEETGEE